MFFKAIPITGILVFASAGMSEGDNKKQVSDSRILRLYHQAKDSKTRKEVEKVLGQPIYDFVIPSGFKNEESSQVWYIDERESPSKYGESPWGHGGIVVDYDAKGKVVEIRFNGQWVKDEDFRAYRVFLPKAKQEELNDNEKPVSPTKVEVKVDSIPPMLKR